MTKLNNAQQQQVTELGEATDKEFANLMLKYTGIITSEELQEMYNEAMELEESGDFVQTYYDANFYSVASEYCELDNDAISEVFGWYGTYSLYMDELGQGLVVGYY